MYRGLFTVSQSTHNGVTTATAGNHIGALPLADDRRTLMGYATDKPLHAPLSYNIQKGQGFASPRFAGDRGPASSSTRDRDTSCLTGLGCASGADPGYRYPVPTGRNAALRSRGRQPACPCRQCSRAPLWPVSTTGSRTADSIGPHRSGRKRARTSDIWRLTSHIDPPEVVPKRILRPDAVLACDGGEVLAEGAMGYGSGQVPVRVGQELQAVL